MWDVLPASALAWVLLSSIDVLDERWLQSFGLSVGYEKQLRRLIERELGLRYYILNQAPSMPILGRQFFGFLIELNKGDSSEGVLTNDELLV